MHTYAVTSKCIEYIYELHALYSECYIMLYMLNYMHSHVHARFSHVNSREHFTKVRYTSNFRFEKFL